MKTSALLPTLSTMAVALACAALLVIADAASACAVAPALPCAASPS